MAFFRAKAGIVLAALLLFTTTGFTRDMLHTQSSDKNMDEPVLATNMTAGDFINWPTFYGVQQTGMINASSDCFGLFGQNITPWPVGQSVPSWPHASFESPPGTGQEYLFVGAIWVGGIINGDTLVSTGFDGWSSTGHEYFPPDYPDRGTVLPFSYITDYSMRALFTDTMTEGVTPDYWTGRAHIPLNVRFANRSHIWQTDNYQDFVLYDVIVTNIGSQMIEAAYVGIYADADAALVSSYTGYQDDLAGSLPNHGIAYIIDNDGDPLAGVFNPATSLRKCFAVKLLASSHSLNRQNFNWWVSSSNAAVDFGPRQKGTADDPYFDFGTGGTGTPEGDINKYYMLSHEEWDYDQVFTASITEDDPVWLYPSQYADADISNGFDTKFLLSFGPVNLAPGENLRLLFAMISGDSVHVVPSNGNWLPYYPVEYLSNLNFDNLIERAELADEKAVELLNPMLPPIGLHVAKEDPSSPTVAWDAWVFDGITGHNIYLGAIPHEDIPYPGVVPPWLILDDQTRYASTGPLQTTYTFDKLKPGSVYYTNVAHNTTSGTGQLSEPVLLDARKLDPPRVDIQTVFYNPNCVGDGTTLCQTYPTISWSPPKGIGVNYYQIYRFSDSLEFVSKYYPFYDRGEASRLIPPKDTIVMASDTFFFYAMDAYATVGGDVSKFTDTAPIDGAYYVVTAVDKNDCETRFSNEVKAYAVANFEKDVLVLTSLASSWASRDSIRVFYEDVLGGYSYDIFSVTDTMAKYNCWVSFNECVNWQDFTYYKILIVEEDVWAPFFTKTFEEKSQAVTNYLLAGGKLVYFGGFEGFINVDRRVAKLYPLDFEFIRRFFGVDNVYYYGLGFYGLPFPCGYTPDTCFAFNEAQSLVSSIPSVLYDRTRSPFSDMVNCYWQTAVSPPSVATFGVNDRGRTSHVFRSEYPDISWLEGDPVGIKTTTSETETYLFGFKLWYMQRESAKRLLDVLGRRLLKDVAAKDPIGVAASVGLSQNYPNPFNPSTVITFELPKACGVTLRVYNILGQQVKELVNADNMPAGVHNIEWHGDNAAGDRVSSGVYFYRLEAGDEVASRTMIMIK